MKILDAKVTELEKEIERTTGKKLKDADKQLKDTDENLKDMGKKLKDAAAKKLHNMRRTAKGRQASKKRTGSRLTQRPRGVRGTRRALPSSAGMRKTIKGKRTAGRHVRNDREVV